MIQHPNEILAELLAKFVDDDGRFVDVKGEPVIRGRDRIANLGCAMEKGREVRRRLEEAQALRAQRYAEVFGELLARLGEDEAEIEAEAEFQGRYMIDVKRRASLHLWSALLRVTEAIAAAMEAPSALNPYDLLPLAHNLAELQAKVDKLKPMQAIAEELGLDR